MKNKMRKSYQKQLTNMLKHANKKLKEDDKILGRFFVLQRSSQWYGFEDKSGGLLYATLRCYDRETGHYKDYLYSFAPYFQGKYWHLYMDIINNFIVNEVKWNIRGEHIDYIDCGYTQDDFREEMIY